MKRIVPAGRKLYSTFEECLNMKMISRRSFLAAAGLSVAALALTACGGSSSSVASSVASSASSEAASTSAAAGELTTVMAGKLTMATNATFPPYEMTTDSGDIEGIDVATAKANAERDGVEIRLYRIIYDAIEEITTAMKGMLAPKFREVELGRAEVRQVYKISNVGTVAGCYVLSGKLTRNCEIRVVRDGIIVADDKIGSLKRFKDDAKEVTSGYECGVTLEKFADVKTGDIFEAFTMEEYRED